MILRILVSGQPARSIAAVRLEKSPILRSPAGLTTSPTARAGYPPPVSFVMANILEKGIILILGEVGPDPNILLTRDADHVVDRRDIILDGRVVAPERGRAETSLPRQTRHVGQ